MGAAEILDISPVEVSVTYKRANENDHANESPILHRENFEQ